MANFAFASATTYSYATVCEECAIWIWSDTPLHRPVWHHDCWERVEARALTRGMHAMVNGD